MNSGAREYHKWKWENNNSKKIIVEQFESKLLYTYTKRASLVCGHSSEVPSDASMSQHLLIVVFFFLTNNLWYTASILTDFNGIDFFSTQLSLLSVNLFSWNLISWLRSPQTNMCSWASLGLNSPLLVPQVRRPISMSVVNNYSHDISRNAFCQGTKPK